MVHTNFQQVIWLQEKSVGPLSLTLVGMGWLLGYLEKMNFLKLAWESEWFLLAWNYMDFLGCKVPCLLIQSCKNCIWGSSRAKRRARVLSACAMVELNPVQHQLITVHQAIVWRPHGHEPRELRGVRPLQQESGRSSKKERGSFVQEVFQIFVVVTLILANDSLPDVTDK